jgi:exonuclease III
MAHNQLDLMSNLPAFNYEELSFISYNLHGFNQGSILLRSICDSDHKTDVILVQEHWLTRDNIHKMSSFCTEYISFGISAMNKTIDSGVLRGRPFGGVMSMINVKWGKFIRFSECRERFVVLLLQNTLIVNVYLPTVNNDIDRDELSDIISELNDVMDQAVKVSTSSTIKVIIGGDFNCVFGHNVGACSVLNPFMSKWSMALVNDIIPSNLNYSYCHETLQHYSLIDYFLVSDNCKTDLLHNLIIDAADNLSDHLPIKITIKNIDLDSANTGIGIDVNCNSVLHNKPIAMIDWISGNKLYFYEATRNYVQPIFDKLDALKRNYISRVNESEVSTFPDSNFKCTLEGSGIKESFIVDLEIIYAEFISALNKAANDTLPVKTMQNVKKFWWDQELKELKSNSISTHRAWVSAGRPRQGEFLLAKQKAKLKYKSMIKFKKSKAKGKITDSLCDALLDKNQQSFWKVWKLNFGNKDKQCKCVEGLIDEASIANKFADYFSKTCNSNNFNSDNEIRDKILFQNRLLGYTGSVNNFDNIIDVNVIQTIIDELGLGKAAGFDRLSAEHIKYSHPIVIVFIAKLFSLMVMLNYVPTDFGKGITIPLLKQDSKHSGKKIEDYRGITISPVISKVFEHALLKFAGSFLTSEKTQIGFKKSHGCTHAIYIVRKTIEYFSLNSSTVNVCALDISKAFDKVNHVKLFLKLMDRNIPVKFILLLQCWYSKSAISVRWGSAMSDFVVLSAGVRQGGVLSPALFGIFVDGLLTKLRKSGLGCHIKGLCLNSIMYADDLILLSISVTQMQQMIDLCSNMLDDCDLQLNNDKSVCLRIGPRHNFNDINLQINGIPVAMKSEIRYLGIFILAGAKFKCKLQVGRQKFYRSLNGIFSKIGVASPVNMTLSLIDSFCIPVLLYGMEAMNLNNSALKEIDNVYDCAFAKIFKVKEKQVIKQCQFFSGSLPATCRLDLRRLNFFDGMNRVIYSPQYMLFQWFGFAEKTLILNKYKIDVKSSSASRLACIWSWFGNLVNLPG